METKVKILPAFFTGTYGSELRTDISYVPLIFSVSSPRQELRITVPYLSIRAEEPVSFTGGEVFSPGRGNPFAGGRLRMREEETTESGAGDVVVREDVFFVRGSWKRPWVWGGVRVKLPTADDSRGLGTGELDYGPSFGVIQPLGRRWTLLASVDHVIRGDPDGLDLRDTTWGSAGVQARPSPKDSLSLFYERRESLLPGRDPLTDVSLTWSRRLTPSVSLPLTGWYGLSDSAEDWGISLGLSLR